MATRHIVSKNYRSLWSGSIRAKCVIRIGITILYSFVIASSEFRTMLATAV